MTNKKTARPSRKKPAPPAAAGDFNALVSSIVHIHQESQAFAARAVNVSLTLRNWLIGWRIVEFEQEGADRAAYGDRLMDALSQRLAARGLPRVTSRELRRFRQFYQVYPQIWQSVTAKSIEAAGLMTLLPSRDASQTRIRESVTPESQIGKSVNPQLAQRLSFTHLNTYVAWYRKHQMTPGDQPPIGILLCTCKNDALVEFALGDLSNKVFVSRYAVELPKKEEMEKFIAQLGKEIGE